MASSAEERATRLAEESDLWRSVSRDPRLRSWLRTLESESADKTLSESARRRAHLELLDAQEVLLAEDTRTRHATRERYEELISTVDRAIAAGHLDLPKLERVASFDGDSFLSQAVDICVSHNEGSDVLAARHRTDTTKPRFTRALPVGRSTADLLLVAASLRLSDILDFDRERTPKILYDYLLRDKRGVSVERSELEWAKHLAVAHWSIEPGAVIYRIRSFSPIVHHAVVTFCEVIETEITRTRATLSAVGMGWPYVLPDRVVADVHAEGYRYLPSGIQLDDERIYELMMGRALYSEPLVALRELLQNAVDACRLRDVHTRMSEPVVEPRSSGRIRIAYSRSGDDPPTLTISDTGTGMDQVAIDTWLLRVGQSYYQSLDFAKLRAHLRDSELDFAPVSEFGIGFIACFMLADQVDIRTAMWRPLRGDTRFRRLKIDGPHRLIRLDEDANEGAKPFAGTDVVLHLARGSPSNAEAPPLPEEIRAYVKSICVDLPFSVELALSPHDADAVEVLNPSPRLPSLPPHLEPAGTTIEVDDDTVGLSGQIILVDPCLGQALERTEADATPVRTSDTHFPADEERQTSVLTRGGFLIGSVPGLPTGSFRVSVGAVASLQLTWGRSESLRYASPTLPRTGLIDQSALHSAVVSAWLGSLLERAGAGETLCFGLLVGPRLSPQEAWFEQHSALAVFNLVWGAWSTRLAASEIPGDRLEKWQRGEGGLLPLHQIKHTLAGELAKWVLPRICDLSVDFEGDVWAAPPMQGWADTLSEWYDYSGGPLEWPQLIGFTNKVPHGLAAYSYAGRIWFNRKYEALRAWSTDDLSQVGATVHKVLQARQFRWPVDLSQQERALLDRLRGAVGGAALGRLHDRYTFDELIAG